MIFFNSFLNQKSNILEQPKTQHCTKLVRTDGFNISILPKLLCYGIPVCIGYFTNESVFAKAVFAFFKNNGFTCMKLGQWLGTRHDLLSKNICQQLSILHDIAPQHDLRFSLSMFNEELGDAITLIDRVPIGSGCIAQVYKAIYKGKIVAVKVLHPGIRSKIERDLNLFEKITSFIFDKRFLMQFRVDVRNQLDLRIEADNLKILKHNFSGYRNVKVPEIYFASESILIEEFIDCRKVLDADLGVRERDKILFTAQNIISKMVFRDRFIHCDLHPGNIVLDDRNRLVMLDAGMCRYLHDKQYANMIDLLFSALFSKDHYEVGKLLIERYENQKPYQAEIFKEQFGRELLVNKNPKGAFWLLRKHNVRLDYTYSSIMMTTLCLDGIMRRLCNNPYGDFYKVLYINFPWIYFLKRFSKLD